MSAGRIFRASGGSWQVCAAGRIAGMSKAFRRECDDASLELEPAPLAAAAQGKNYISPAGFARLKAELKALVEDERPRVVQTVAWAARQALSWAACLTFSLQDWSIG